MRKPPRKDTPHDSKPRPRARPRPGHARRPVPVPVAWLGRTSTMVLQDPDASLRRQLAKVEGKLPPGWFIAARYWDVESGGLDLEQRGHGSYDHLNIGVPRDGGLADLLHEAASPSAEVRGGDVRGHRPVRPRHLQRPQTRKTARRRRDPADRRRRAHQRQRRDDRHHPAAAPDEAGRRRVVPVRSQGEVRRRVQGPLPGRVQHRPRPLRVRRRTASRTPSRPRPRRDGPRPGSSPTRSPDRSWRRSSTGGCWTGSA